MKFPVNTSARSARAKVRPVFLYDAMPPLSVTDKVDVVLSPELYWFRIEDIPVKSASKAKKLAPSLFDSVVPDGIYEYAVVLHEETFWMFAFEPERIRNALEAANIRPSQVRAIYFAQTECFDADAALNVDGDRALVSYEGTVGMVPSRYTDVESSVEEFCALTARSSHKIGINLYHSNLIDDRQLNRLIVLMIILLTLFLADYMLQRKKFAEQLGIAQSIQSEYKLPKTSLQTKSILRTLERREANQIALRKRFKALLDLPLQRGESVNVLQFEQKKLKVQIVIKNDRRAEVLKTALTKIGRIVSAKVKKNIFHVSVAYE